MGVADGGAAVLVVDVTGLLVEVVLIVVLLVVVWCLGFPAVTGRVNARAVRV